MAMNSRLALIGVMGCVVLIGDVRAARPRPDDPKAAVGRMTPPSQTTTAMPPNPQEQPAAPATPVVLSTSTNAANAANTNSTSPSAAFAAGGVQVETVGGGYNIIQDRNVFHLNEPPPPQATNDPLPPPNIKITGIYRIGKELRALFAIPPKEAKDPTTYVNLAEGEQAGVLELVKIFEDKEECDVVNANIRMTLSFKNNSYIPPKPAAGAPGQPMPMGNPAPPQPMPTPVANYQNPNPQTGSSASRVIVAGPTPIAPAGANPGGQIQPANGSPEMRTIPTRGGNGGVPPRTMRLQPQAMSTDEQLANMVIAHAVADAAGNANSLRPNYNSRPNYRPGNRLYPTPVIVPGTHSSDFPPPLPDVEVLLNQR